MTGATTAPPARADTPTRRRHEGLVVGALGGTGVWLWLLVSDMHSRTAFSTPAFLGRGLLSINAPSAHIPALAGVVAFTIAHYALWIAVGAGLMRAVTRAARTPSILLAVVVLFVLTQFLFVGITAILAQGRLGAAAWRDLLIGDAIGWSVVAWHLLRAHRELRAELARAAQGDDA